MRHETVTTAPREQTGKVRKDHGKKHHLNIEATPSETKPAVVPETPGLMGMFNDMERMMEEAWNRPLFGFGMPWLRTMMHEPLKWAEMNPAVDMYEEDNDVVVKAEIPGIDKEKLDVRLEGNRLTITGKRDAEEKVERKDYMRVERSHGSFTRTLTLPEGVDTEKAAAALKDGVLEVRIPRNRDQITARKIDVA